MGGEEGGEEEEGEEGGREVKREEGRWVIWLESRCKRRREGRKGRRERGKEVREL